METKLRSCISRCISYLSFMLWPKQFPAIRNRVPGVTPLRPNLQCKPTPRGNLHDLFRIPLSQPIKFTTKSIIRSKYLASYLILLFLIPTKAPELRTQGLTEREGVTHLRIIGVAKRFFGAFQSQMRPGHVQYLLFSLSTR